MAIRNICIFGVGGVGGYFGGHLAKLAEEKHDLHVHFVARGEHGKAIRERGLTVKTGGGESSFTVRPATCTEDVAVLPPCDAVILAVKGYDLDDAVDRIRSLVRDDTVVLPLLNGVDIHDRIRKRLAAGIVLPACVYIGTHIESPGVVSQAGGAATILLGKDPGNPDVRPDELLGLFDEAKIRYELQEDVAVAIWSKYIFIAAFGLVTARYGKTLGEVFEDAELGSTVRRIMAEIEAIARKAHIALPADIVRTSFEKAGQFSRDTKTSFQRDIEAGKRNEGDLFGGTIVRLGRTYGVPTPTTETIYGELFPGHTR